MTPLPAPGPADVHAALDRIVPTADPLRVVVFGSVGRGEAVSGSDLDLLVVMPDGTDRRAATVELLVSLADLGVPKDVVVMMPAHAALHRDSGWHVVGAALRDGRTVYARS